MPRSDFPLPGEIDHLLWNAQLRDELEPFLDESISCLRFNSLTTEVENDYLASMLAWERAPAIPISKWFEPELKTHHPDTMDDRELHAVLWNTIRCLFEKRIVLDFTDHLSDRELYTLIYRDILPSTEKKIESVKNYLHWDCADTGRNPETWLRYYATDEERRGWKETLNEEPPPPEPPPFPRELPRRPL